MSSKPAPKIYGELVIVVLKAKNLVNREAIGKADPFATFRIGSNAKRTKTDKRGGQHPEWDEEIRFQLTDEPSNKKMKIQVYNEDKREHDLIGETVIELNKVLTEGEWDEAGEIFLEITFYRAGKPPSDANPQEIKNQINTPSHPPVTNPHQQPPYNNLTHTSSLSAHTSPNIATAYPQQPVSSQYPPPLSTSPNSAPAAINYQPQNNVYPPVNNSTYPHPPVQQMSGTFYSPAIQSRPPPQHQATLPLQPPATSGYPPASGISGYPPINSPPIQSSPLPMSSPLPLLNSPPPVNASVPMAFPVPVATPSGGGGYPSNVYPPINQYNSGYPNNNVYPNQQAYPPTNVYPPPAQAGTQPYPPPQFGQAYPPYS
ncbi:6088_t:CDS:2 [Ambispora leptoticha]|uniref:6088_t:CDS:1 n=1 Tax=Ambispora leptoticha TaxID=144679 RepID=A0A9N8V9T9_9GLOM|nr:6088_t:CDS:2 [Ambispora leptoticha]